MACTGAALAPAAAAAAPAALSIERGKKLVAYRDTVSISGRLSTGERGVKVVLRSDRFPFDAFKTVASATTRDGGKYHFERKPTLGTRYRVFLRRRPSVRSRAVTAYVSPFGKLISCNYCRHGPDGHGTFTFRETLDVTGPSEFHPARVYFYWGQFNGDAHTWPSEVRRVKTLHPKQLAPGKVRIKVRYRFTIPNRPYSYAFRLCGRDHFARDGLGLPKHHHCGDTRIPYPEYRKYLG